MKGKEHFVTPSVCVQPKLINIYRSEETYSSVMLGTCVTVRVLDTSDVPVTTRVAWVTRGHTALVLR